MEGTQCHHQSSADTSSLRTTSDPQHDKEWDASAPRRMASPRMGGRKTYGNKRAHGKRKPRRWKPYAELTWEERRDLVEREAQQADAANTAALSRLQKSTTKGTVALPIAPRLTGATIMDEREERLGLARLTSQDHGDSEDDDSYHHQQQQQRQQREASKSQHADATQMDGSMDAHAGPDMATTPAGARMDEGMDTRASEATAAMDGPASPADSSEEDEFEEAFEDCMHEDYGAMSREELIARLQEKDAQVSTLERRLSQAQQEQQGQEQDQQQQQQQHQQQQQQQHQQGGAVVGESA